MNPPRHLEPAKTAGFVQGLGLLDSTMIVAGSMIGSGIFIVSADIARQVGSTGWLLMAWLVTGALTSKAISDPLALLRELGADAYHPSMKILDAEQVTLLRQAGYGVNVWTVNEEADVRKLMAWGVTGIITDFPQVLKKIVESK